MRSPDRHSETGASRVCRTLGGRGSYGPVNIERGTRADIEWPPADCSCDSVRAILSGWLSNAVAHW